MGVDGSDPDCANMELCPREAVCPNDGASPNVLLPAGPESKNKMNILTSILSSKYFFQICGSQTFPYQGPPKLHVFGCRPPSREKSFQGPPEAEI